MERIETAETLIDQVYERVVEAIADGALPAGTRIRQGELAARLGVSRQPVSHALHLLHRQGLLRESGRKGFEIAPDDPARIAQIYDVRAALDGLAASRAAARRDEAALAELDAIIAATRNAQGIPALLRLDLAFHRALYRASGNPVFEAMTDPHFPALARAMAAVLEAEDYRARAAREHETILARVREGDAAGAEAAARDHARNAGEITARRLADRAQAG
ncbi:MULTISPECIES: GntR family transcriptional regulator [unclassified Acidiphilium]|uniref:GntR family transcriptional regulator n=1 Tax=unclassified Acidiphilium TaxID=2617493 RepID=UPI000BD00481|nr:MULTISPECIES: GntR family transcriptional regulator [unclassified Acidiphilium]OYV57387.1 MAG: transcriptional regulator [Acidiphilium sp. 20-67-58]HQT59754.1 GntR family transcriptional regulator [Acidiphilium sp.]